MSINQLPIYVGKSREEVEAPMLKWLTTEWDFAGWSDSTTDSAVLGTVDECIEQLRAHLKAGVQQITLVPYRFDMEQIELIAKEILPEIG
jgi:alkanesulfonate monooxygenase